MMTQSEFEARMKRAAENAIKASQERQKRQVRRHVKNESGEWIFEGATMAYPGESFDEALIRESNEKSIIITESS